MLDKPFLEVFPLIQRLVKTIINPKITAPNLLQSLISGLYFKGLYFISAYEDMSSRAPVSFSLRTVVCSVPVSFS